MTHGIRPAAVALALAGLFAAQPALADPVYGNTYQLRYEGAYTGYISPVYLYNSPPPVGGNPTAVSSGSDRMTNTTLGVSNIEAWCVDIFDWLQSNHQYVYQSGTTFFATNPPDANPVAGNPNAVAALGRLATNHLAEARTSAVASGAFQMAVWEIVNEDPENSWNVLTGNLRADAANNAADTLANQWLASNATESNSMSVNVYETTGTTPRSQSLVVFSPVPEPAPLALFGLGLFGLYWIRRKNA